MKIMQFEYKDIIRYIIDNLINYREDIENILSRMDRYRMSFKRADINSKLTDVILSAINDYEIDNDYEEDEILDYILDEYEIEDIFLDAVNDMNDVNEGYNTVQWQHFDNDDRRYEYYVLVDGSDMAVIANYKVWPGDFWKNVLTAAIDDAKEEARQNKYGTYLVFGCIGNEYSDDTLVFSTDDI